MVEQKKELPLEEWINTVPKKLRDDPLWDSAYYRLATYLYDMVWNDCELINRDFRGREVVHQIVRSSGSVCANIEEAYGRGIGSQDYLRILRIALGEARETRGWYFRARHTLPGDLLDRRIDLITQIIALLVNILSTHRKKLVAQ